MIDLVVAVGGPAGLATAIHAARAGLETVVIEKRTGPIDKACGEGLMPHAVRQLALLGARPAGKPFKGISYFDEKHSVRAYFDNGDGFGVRRKALHAALLTEADRAGVKLVHDKVGPLTQDAESVTVNGIRARYLAAADGLHSPFGRPRALSCPRAGRNAGVSSATSPSHRGASSSRCTGPNTPRPTSPRSPTTVWASRC